MTIALAQKERLLRQDFKLVLSALVLLCVDILITYPETAIYFVVGIIAIAVSQVNFFRSRRRLMYTILAICGAVLFLNAWSEPSHSFLLSRVQDHFQEILNQGNESGSSANYSKMIEMIFNTARVMYVVFLLFVTWQGFRNFQQGEEMSELVRMGVYSVVAVLAVDVTSQFVLGTGA